MTADLSVLLDQLKDRTGFSGFLHVTADELIALAEVAQAAEEVKQTSWFGMRPEGQARALSDALARLRRVLAGEEK